MTASNPPDPQHFPDSLPLTDDAQGASYILDSDTRLALRMAWVTQRPLLVVGEAGCGKTDLARALARSWGVPLLSHVVHARTEAADLLYQFDAVARLADAQVFAALQEKAPEGADPLDARHYLRPGPLWWLINRTSASNLNNDRQPHRQFEPPAGMDTAAEGAVVLIDEIDKGTEAVTEGLLEVLDTQSFTVPWTGQRVELPAKDPKQVRATGRNLVLITSNAARDLPAPFLRRCIALHMALPSDHSELIDWLIKRGQAHCGRAQTCSPEAMRQAAQVIAEHRTQTDAYRPGLAEFLYLLDAVTALAPGDKKQQEALVKDFAPSVTGHKAQASQRA